MRIQAMREGAVDFLAKPGDHPLSLETVWNRSHHGAWHLYGHLTGTP